MLIAIWRGYGKVSVGELIVRQVVNLLGNIS